MDVALQSAKLTGNHYGVCYVHIIQSDICTGTFIKNLTKMK